MWLEIVVCAYFTLHGSILAFMQFKSYLYQDLWYDEKEIDDTKCIQLYCYLKEHDIIHECFIVVMCMGKCLFYPYAHHFICQTMHIVKPKIK